MQLWIWLSLGNISHVDAFMRSAAEALQKFLTRAETISVAYDKYRESAYVLDAALNHTSTTLSTLTQHRYLFAVSR